MLKKCYIVSDSSLGIGNPLLIVEGENREEACKSLGGKRGKLKKEIIFSLDEIQKDERWEKVPEESVSQERCLTFKMKGDSSGSLKLSFYPDDPKVIFWLEKSVLVIN